MIKDNQRILNGIHVFLDAVVIVAAYLIAWHLKFGRGDADAILSISQQEYFSFLQYIVPVFLVLYYWCGLYLSKRYSSSEAEVINVLKANAIGVGVIIAGLYIWKIIDFSRAMFAMFYCITCFLEIFYRQVLRAILRSIRSKGFNLKHVLLVGYSRACEKYIDKLHENPQWGFEVFGILDDHIPTGTNYKGVKVIGTIDAINDLLPENKFDEIGIALSLSDYGKLESLVNICEKSGVHTKFIPDYNSVIPSKPYQEDLSGLTVINIRHVPLTSNLNKLIKRIMDIVGSIMCLILFSPIMLISAIMIKLGDKGPVIFSQERVGLHNKKFRMYKFRTMRQQTEEEEKKGWSKKGDARVTKVGKFLRMTSLDELPQMVNVLKGDMSLIGPRPERPQFVDKFKEEIPRYMIKHQVRPGVTGWAQINGFRGNTSIRKRIEYDLYYIENWTVFFDIKILFLTIFKGFINKNAC